MRITVGTSSSLVLLAGADHYRIDTHSPLFRSQDIHRVGALIVKEKRLQGIPQAVSPHIVG